MVMKKGFYDRFRELSILKDKFNSLNKGELCVLYGRRRVGKTELILHFLDSINSKKIYLYVNKLARKTLMLQFSDDIKSQTQDDIRISGTWDAFFNYLIEESKEKKIVVVIDEFQRLSAISEDFITMLQHKWDTALKNNKIMIILLGSSMGMTHNLVFSSQGPLYGRCTYNFRIRPFRYVDFRDMFQELDSEEERIKLFSVFGGTPYYLALVKQGKKDLWASIKNLVLTEGSPLYDEPLTLLSSELKSYLRHNSILVSASQGKTELSDFANITGLETNQITPHVEHLTNRLDILKKTEPIFGKKKKTRYEISDNFFKFWYRFVFPHKSTLEMRNTEIVLDKIKTELDGYTSWVFENICRELLILYNGDKIKGHSINFEKIGSWWEKSEEIDIVAYSRRETLLGEVKWSNKPVNGLSILNALERKSKKIEFNGRIKYVIISKEGFKDNTLKTLEQRGVLCLNLKEIEDLFNQIAKKEITHQRTLEPYTI